MAFLKTKQPLIIISGPTASGKTAVSVELCKKIGGCVISADSMQVYKGMDIGSAKVTVEEMQGVPHYLIDELSVFEPFHVVRFVEMAKKAIEDIRNKGMIPVVCGGTGFYIQALLYDIDFTEGEEDSELRDQLLSFAKEKGATALHDRLKEIDPESADAIHENNIKRVIRAIEFYTLTGEKISVHNEREREKTSPYDFRYFVLSMPRDILYKRIDERVDLMLEKGLVEEVRRLKELGATKDMVSMQGLGYKEILSYLDGEITLPEAVYLIKRDTRHFAKRQITWYKREKDIRVLDWEEASWSVERMVEAIEQWI